MFEGVAGRVEQRGNIAIDDYKISDKECGIPGTNHDKISLHSIMGPESKF